MGREEGIRVDISDESWIVATLGVERVREATEEAMGRRSPSALRARSNSHLV